MREEGREFVASPSGISHSCNCDVVLVQEVVAVCPCVCMSLSNFPGAGQYNMLPQSSIHQPSPACGDCTVGLGDCVAGYGRVVIPLFPYTPAPTM